MKSNILITGGLGYIGSHLYIALAKKGLSPVIVDDLSRSHLNVLRNLEKIINNKVFFYKAKVQEKKKIASIIEKHSIDSVFHLAGFKSIEESTKHPLEYYDNNINTTLSLLDTIKGSNCNKIIFSSSASVYGETSSKPVKETDKLRPLNTYAQTKVICEKIIF